MITDEELQRMPWTRDAMTNEEIQSWLASRKEAGLAIDIETCELRHWKAPDADPYGVRSDLPPDIQRVVSNCFVRSPASNGWINEADLPMEKVWAMCARLDRNAE